MGGGLNPCSDNECTNPLHFIQEQFPTYGVANLHFASLAMLVLPFQPVRPVCQGGSTLSDQSDWSNRSDWSIRFVCCFWLSIWVRLGGFMG